MGMGKEAINLFEAGSDTVPSEEEIRSVFENLAGAPDFKNIRKLEDDEGIYLWEVSAPTEDGRAKYLYIRKGTHDESRSLVTKISFSRFDKAGAPVESGTAAKLIDGEWDMMD